MQQSALATLPLALLVGSSILASPACDVTIKDGEVSVNQLHGRATREWSRTYPFSAGGTLAVTNANGPIDVVTGPPGNVGVVAILSAKAMTDERANELLGDAKIDEAATPAHVKLSTVRGNRSGGLEVHYKATVPPDARVELTSNNGVLTVQGLRGHVKAMVVNGGVELAGLRGSVDAASVNGSISVKMAEVTARIRLESTNGRIALEIPKGAKATLNARSVNGGLSVTGLGVEEASGRRIRNLESALNGGGPEIDVRVTNGRITIEGR